MLRLRSQAKSSIHAEMTIIGPRAVNPLKAAWDVDVALRHLLAPRAHRPHGPGARGDRRLRRLARARSRPRRRHPGRAAEPARTFQPRTQFDQRLEGGALDRFLPANRKARQWDLLLELYEDIAKEAQEDFWSVFEREFRRAYATGSQRAVA